ncbi:MAG: hypothetical protein WC150_14705 [Bacteroidia bacterium]
MKTLIKLFISFLPLVSFGQIFQSPEEIALVKKNRIKQINVIYRHYSENKLKSKDTILGYNKFDKNGRLIEKKYSIGTSIRHQIIYGDNGKIVKEIRLMPKPQGFDPTAYKMSLPDSCFVDTFDNTDYFYDKEKIIKTITTSESFGRTEKVYTYSDNGNLLSIIETNKNSLGDFIIYKYRGHEIDYEINNRQKMTSEIFYNYNTDGTLESKEYLFGGTSTLINYNNVGLMTKSITTDCNDKILKLTQVTFNDKGFHQSIVTLRKLDNTGNYYVVMEEIYEYIEY